MGGAGIHACIKSIAMDWWQQISNMTRACGTRLFLELPACWSIENQLLAAAILT